MNRKRLGKNGPSVSAIGLGCMGMSEFYGKADEVESRKVILAALEKGITMLDTADTYGFGHNEELIGNTLKEWKGEVFIATKCGIERKKGEYKRSINNRPDYIRQSLEGSLRRLKRDHVDLYYLHRLDSSTPLEDSIGELSRLVKEGKIRYVGLSEVSASTIEKAHSIHPLTAVQSEYSLFTRNAEAVILPAIERLGIGFVAYSPLGRGFLSGKLDKNEMKKEGDLRMFLPRTSDEYYDANRELVRQLEHFSLTKGITPAQASLAWVISKGDYIVPIPGTKREKYLLENIAAADIVLDKKSCEHLESIFFPGAVKGERYTVEGMVGIES
jgi:aryl-alcohol dehydrogenase-like predicted oxidoreductase